MIQNNQLNCGLFEFDGLPVLGDCGDSTSVLYLAQGSDCVEHFFGFTF